MAMNLFERVTSSHEHIWMSVLKWNLGSNLVGTCIFIRTFYLRPLSHMTNVWTNIYGMGTLYNNKPSKPHQ